MNEACYQTYQIFVTFLRLDLQFQIMLILLVGLFWFDSNFASQYTFYLDIASVVVNIGFAVLGLIAVRRENRVLLVVFVVLSWIVPAYLTWRCGARIAFCFCLCLDVVFNNRTIYIISRLPSVQRRGARNGAPI